MSKYAHKKIESNGTREHMHIQIAHITRNGWIS